MPPGLPLPALDLHVVFDVADDMPSGEEPMGDNLADAASASPLGELPRVVQVCRVFSFALLSAYSALSLSLDQPLIENNPTRSTDQSSAPY